MMISPGYYVKRFTDSSYQELMDERDRLLKSIKNYEELEKKGDRSGDDWQINPSPNVRYQCNLEYLAQLSILMCEKYNREYVWGNKSLAENINDASHKSKLNEKILMRFEPVDPEKIREKMEESRQKVKRSLRAIELPEEIKQKVISGEIKLEDAMKKYLPDEEL